MTQPNQLKHKFSTHSRPNQPNPTRGSTQPMDNSAVDFKKAIGPLTGKSQIKSLRHTQESRVQTELNPLSRTSNLISSSLVIKSNRREWSNSRDTLNRMSLFGFCPSLLHDHPNRVMRWLRLLFDGRSTDVRLLIKGH